MTEWYIGIGTMERYIGMGTMERDITEQIYEKNELLAYIRRNEDEYINWELTYNRICLQVDKLYEQKKLAKILES